MSNLKDTYYSERDKKIVEETLGGVKNFVKAELKPIKAELKSINHKLDNHITDTNKKMVHDNLSSV